jgi:hypothetical protein
MTRVTTKQGVTIQLRVPPTSEAAVAAFEAARGIRLPDEYREFLLATNGGRPEPAEFRLARRSGPYTDSAVHRFLSLGDTEAPSLERMTQILAPRVPPELQPIASDPGGNYVCIGVAGDGRGKIYFWDQDRAPEPADWSGVDLIADSFDAFLRGLT